MSQETAVDIQYVTAHCKASWNSWPGEGRRIWSKAHGFVPTSLPWDFQNTEIKDALFCDYLDLASREVE